MVWLFWLSTLIFGVAVCLFICNKIEKTKLERLGATGKIFKY